MEQEKTNRSITRRKFVASAAGSAAVVAAFPMSGRAHSAPSADSSANAWTHPGHAPVDTAVPPDTQWHSVSEWGVEGKAWDATTRYYDRLPTRAEKLVREPVWNLSRHSAGMVARFETDSRSIHIRYSLLHEDLAMPHMPATGVSGVDLYGEDYQGEDRWINVVMPTEQAVEVVLAQNLAPGLRRYTIYLPLYNGVETLDIGVEPDVFFEPVSPRTDKPILFYGTSIMHGACASRPGMAIPAIVGRRLKMPVINLGFSGNGRMEPEIAELLGELDPAVFALDCIPNMNAGMIRERVVPFVEHLKSVRPDTPILLVEDRAFTSTPFFPARGKIHRTNRLALREAYKQLLAEGMDGLFYLAGKDLLGQDGEATTDGSHPSDLGMMRYADAYEPALRSILRRY